jgi:hypothetical protein
MVLIDVASRRSPTGRLQLPAFPPCLQKRILLAFGPSLYHSATPRIVFAPLGPAQSAGLCIPGDEREAEQGPAQNYTMAVDAHLRSQVAAIVSYARHSTVTVDTIAAKCIETSPTVGVVRSAGVVVNVLEPHRTKLRSSTIAD